MPGQRLLVWVPAHNVHYVKLGAYSLVRGGVRWALRAGGVSKPRISGSIHC